MTSASQIHRQTLSRRFVAAIVILCATGLAMPAAASLTIFRSGTRNSTPPAMHGPVLDLAGGGKDVEPALQAMIDDVRGCTSCNTQLDVVVLRASGGDGYNELFMHLDGVASTTTFLITDRDSAQRRDVAEMVRRSQIIFFAGGDQCNYVRWIKGTRTARAIVDVYRRGGGVGGTSAGLAIQGEIAYDSCPDQSAESKTVLQNPYGIDVSLSSGFFRWPSLVGVITDTHFQQRDRMGRLLVFLARTLHDEHRHDMWGVGVCERTSLVVRADGSGRVYGEGPVYFVHATEQPAECVKDKPLTARGFRIARIQTGESVDMKHRPEGTKTIDVVNGKLSGDPY